MWWLRRCACAVRLATASHSSLQLSSTTLRSLKVSCESRVGLSPFSWSLKITFLIGASVPVSFLLLVMAEALQLRSALIILYVLFNLNVLGFVVFFLVRFFSAVSETLSEITLQSNLIPVPRRMQFETRYARFRIMSIVVIVLQVVLIAVAVGTTLFALLRDAIALAQLVTNILSLLISVVFLVCTSVFFHASRTESLKLYGAPQPSEIGGFGSLQEQDEDVFA